MKILEIILIVFALVSSIVIIYFFFKDMSKTINEYDYKDNILYPTKEDENKHT